MTECDDAGCAALSSQRSAAAAAKYSESFLLFRVVFVFVFSVHVCAQNGQCLNNNNNNNNNNNDNNNNNKC